MYKNIYWLLIIIITSFQTKAQTLINGQIDNPENVKSFTIRYANSGYFIKEKKTNITLDNQGKFSINLELNEAGLAYLTFESKNGLYLFKMVYLEPKVKMIINLSSSKPDNYQFLGDLAKENTFLQQYSPEFISQESPLFQEFAKDTIAEICYKKIMDRRQAELIKLDQYATKNKFNATFKQLIRNDIEYYHNYLFDKLAGNFYWQQYRSQENNIFDNQQWGAKWKAVIQPINTQDLALIAKSTWYANMISPFDNFPMWVYCYDMNVKPEDMSEVGRQEGLFPLRLEKKLNNLFKGKLLELHLANFIYSQAIQHHYENYLIPMFDRFKQQFPQSEYLDWLNQEIEIVRQFQTAQNKELSNKIKIIDKYQEIKQLADLLAQFKGKTVVIDLWGTWCGPCKDEFKHTTELKNYFKDKPIEYLYIAYERKSEEMEKYWLKMIKYHNLEGYHLIGNEDLHTDIWQQISKISDEELNNLTGSDKEEMEFVKNSKGEGKVFPNYLIVDKNGNIIFKSAFKPSEKEKLYKQIEQVLNN